VLMRAGHTEAGCDLAGMAGCTPSSVICEIMNDDGTMARLPDLQVFAAEHGLKIGTIADLIEYRSSHESLIERLGSRQLLTPHGAFTAHAFKDLASGNMHLALVIGEWDEQDEVPVRVHEPLSVLDALELNGRMHSWPLNTSLAYLHQQGKGVAVLLNAGETSAELLAQFQGVAQASYGPGAGRVDLRTYGIGAQILRECGVKNMRLMGSPRRIPSLVGYGLDVRGFIENK
jgi:3,4-dihydroxy 2-butanone 4-phosphate synthase/GTP cyclohydrolase II